MGEKKISERKLIFLTVILLVIAGLIRLISYRAGYALFYLAFIPYFYLRLKFYIKRRKNLSKLDVFRRTILILMVFTILMNMLGMQNIEFLLLLLLAIDYLLLSNYKEL